MKPTKLKADELIDKMYYSGNYDDKEDYNPTMAWERAKQCAIIAVDEMMKQCFDYRDIDLQASYDWWQEVKEEIEKL